MRFFYLTIIMFTYLMSSEPVFAKDREASFARALVQSVRTSLRASAHISDRYTACLENDTLWFEEHSIDFRDDIKLCRTRIKNLKNRISIEYREMKLLLALSQGENIDYFSYSNTIDPDDPRIQKQLLSPVLKRYQTRDIEHPYPNLVSPKDLTIEEAKEAIKILNNDLRVKRLIAEGVKEENIESNVCGYAINNIHPWGDVTDIFLGKGTKDCYLKKYKETLFGSEEKGSIGFPILAYLNNEKPSDQEIVFALKNLKKNAESRLTDLEDLFYQVNSRGEYLLNNNVISEGVDSVLPLFGYESSLNMIKEMNKYNDLIERGEEDFSSSEFWRGLRTMGVVIGGVIGCEMLKVTKLVKGLCKSIFGLGANAYFVWQDHSLFTQSLESMLIDPDGSRILENVDRLDDKKFARSLSIFFLPIGTGIPELNQSLKLLPRMKRKFKSLIGK